MTILLSGLPALYVHGLRSLLASLYPEARVTDADNPEEGELEQADGYIVSAQALARHAFILMRRMDRVLLLSFSGNQSTINQGRRERMLRAISPLASERELTGALTSFLRTCTESESCHNVTVTPCPHPTAQEPLTHRQREVLAHTARGLSAKECAEALGISLNTVLTHRKNIAEKLGIRGMAALVHYAMTRGLV